MSLVHQNRSQILVLEGDSIHALELKNTLGRDYNLTIIEDRRDFMELAFAGTYDLLMVNAAGDTLADVCRALREAINLEWVPIIAVADSGEDRISALESGAIDALSKNVDPRMLELKLKNLIHCKQVHERVRESEMETRRKIEELESLVGMVVHDLKSPVIAIHGFIGMLEKRCRDLPEDPRRDEILTFLATTNNKIQEFVQDLAHLLISEEIKLELSEVSLHTAVEEVLRRHQQVIEDKKIDVQVHSGDCLARVIGDERRIIEVVDNLLGNAINYMGEGPELRIQIRFQETVESVLTSFSDNGIGIPAQYHDKIFQRFFRVPTTGTKPGTGLGLSIVKAIVESHGGRIWVESGPGPGTTFNFTLPKDRPVCASRHNGTSETCLLHA